MRIALAFKGVSYDSDIVDIGPPLGDSFTPEDRDAWLAARGPVEVPALTFDDGRVLTDSVAIIEWLEETIPNPALLPREPWGRAQVRRLVQLINAGTQPLQQRTVCEAVSDKVEAQRLWAKQWIERGLAAYEHEVAATQGRFSFGDKLTMADLFLIPQVRHARRRHAQLYKFPRVERIYREAVRLSPFMRTDYDRAARPGEHFEEPP